MTDATVPAIFSLARRRELEEEKSKARRIAQARAKRVLAALTCEVRINEARSGIVEAELAAARAAADSIDASAAPQRGVEPSEQPRDQLYLRAPRRAKRGKERETKGAEP